MAATSRPTKNKYGEYPDDIFKDTRMSFGEHIEELRVRMFNAIKWLCFFLVIGFVLDGVGESMKDPRIGVGKPMLKVITEPVETQVRDFYNRRIEKLALEKLTTQSTASPEEIAAIKEKLQKNNYNLSALDSAERVVLRLVPEAMPVTLPTRPLAEALGVNPAQVKQEEVTLDAQVIPARLTYLSVKGDAILENRQYLGTLSVQEGFVVYFKVSILCSIVLASPFLLYQFWAFVGAGLYPHEKQHVYSMFGPSLVLFLAGVVLCQFIVLPGAVKALLGFNEWLGLDPEIRLREWLGLALLLPLVFGVSFQTPLLMVFLNRIGIFTAADYLSKWRQAFMVMAVFAALITPTPDVITMLYMFVPMFGLYLLGVAVCHYFPASHEALEEAEAEEVAV
ncbi:sec-independent protein subunit : Sec-independent protein translocase protein TatC OS=Planctomyces maris DSM 8797 GN=tatC PE=3 SV=1: TatC [Gemmataceae bacterium]|nr:sec-independent protein subunit : Sec-independent protein translocase protein TatC OS=Planctomyces maris DSM 8797 GN=tatC PE=3 SV=1: TatC [Gemmataceae bacterium]VTU02691.1 sec-independent protein subunit : Sec-independent protein translocase protein TatC OS=Planctomyces maris DSM 8797 GN=tatC PE=3 SV=1: TatC [Gemmataceae bacterium]